MDFGFKEQKCSLEKTILKSLSEIIRVKMKIRCFDQVFIHSLGRIGYLKLLNLLLMKQIQKIVDTLQSLSKMFINNNVLNSSPFPKNDVYTLVNSEFIFDLYKNGIGVFDNNTEQNSLERDFTSLTSEQWNSLKEFGQLKQRPILFAKNNELRITSQEAISEIVRDIEHYPNYRIKIEGHTGTLGDPIKNKILSETRAEWVKKFMVQTYNIDPDRILIVGYGGEKPIPPSIEENEFSKSYQAKLARVSVILLQEEL